MSICTNINGELEIIYENCVLKLYEKQVKNHINYIATVWDEDEQRVKDFVYKTSSKNVFGKAFVDVNCDIARKVYNYYKQEATMSMDLFIKGERKRIKEGRLVKVCKGNKLSKDTIGVVVWSGDTFNKYTCDYENSASIKMSDGSTVFLPQRYIKTIDDDIINITSKERKKIIQEIAYNKCQGWVQYVLDRKVAKNKKNS